MGATGLILTPLLLALAAATAPPPPALLDDPADPAEEEPAPDESAEPAPEAGEAPQLEDPSEADERPARRPQGERPRKEQRKRPAPERSSPGSAEGEGADPLEIALVTLLQIGLGLAVAGATSALWPVSPILVAVTQTLLGDVVGERRGAILPSVFGGYLGMCLCGLTPIALVVVAVAALFLSVVVAPGVFSMFAPYFAVVVFAVYPTLLLALPLGYLGNSTGSALAYLITAEPKLPGDTSFRFPGVLVPAHPTLEEDWDRPLDEEQWDEAPAEEEEDWEARGPLPRRLARAQAY